MTLKYYADEHARWPEAHAAKLRPDEAEIAVGKLWRFAQSRDGLMFPQPELTFTSGARISRGGLNRIKLNLDVLTWLLVAHEVAHSWDIARRRMGKPSGKRWHSRHHARLVDRLVREIMARGWMKGAIALAIDEREERATARERERRDLAKAPETRIARRKVQIARLERKIKSLTTRLRTAKRSLAALERAAARRATRFACTCDDSRPGAVVHVEGCPALDAPVPAPAKRSR